MATPPDQSEPDGKRKVWTHLAFAMPEFSVTIFFATVNSWYFYYLVTILDLPVLLAGVAFAIGRFADALWDPLIGYVADRQGLRVGRKRPIAIALLPTSVGFVALWGLPVLPTTTFGTFLTASLCFVCFTLGYTMLTVPRLAMLPGFVGDGYGRTRQVALDTVCVFLSIAFVTTSIPALVSSMPRRPCPAQTIGHGSYAWACSVPCPCSLIFHSSGGSRTRSRPRRRRPFNRGDVPAQKECPAPCG